MVPDENDSISMTKEKCLAHIDVALGGHIAEKIFLGDKKITSGCGSDLQGATSIAYQAVRRFGMFGSEAGLISKCEKETSEMYNAKVDEEVKRILDDSYTRVHALLMSKEVELRNLSKNLYWHDYLNAEEMEDIIKGKKLGKKRVREWDPKEKYVINF